MRIVHWVEDGILSSRLKPGDKTPSVNACCRMFSLSRSSVVLAMNNLCSRGIVEAQESVGYFVKSTDIEVSEKIFLLFNEFTYFKEDLYRSIVEAAGESTPVDIYFHHYDRKVFESQLQLANGNYTSYVVMPGKFRGLRPLLESIRGRVFLLDHYEDDLRGHFPAVGQDFERDSYEALVEGLPQIRKYDTIVLVQHNEIEPLERYDGICRFCKEYGFTPFHLHSVKEMSLRRSTLYITAEDRELVRLIEQTRKQNLRIGIDVGILSYNESILKEVIADGISTISTDFVQMGRTLLSLIRSQGGSGIPDVHNPWMLKIRRSL